MANNKQHAKDVFDINLYLAMKREELKRDDYDLLLKHPVYETSAVSSYS